MNYTLLQKMQEKMGLTKTAYVPPMEMQEQMDNQQMQSQMEPPPDIKGMAEQEVEEEKRNMMIPPEERLLRIEKQVDILTQFMQEMIAQMQQEQLMKSGSERNMYRDTAYYNAALEGLRYV